MTLQTPAQHSANTGPAKKRLLKTCALVAGIGLFSMQAFAGGDAALYGPTAPKGSTFVRVYNASNAEIIASVGNTSLNDIAPLGSSAFSFLPQGDYTAKLGSQTLPVKLASDHYYTWSTTCPARRNWWKSHRSRTSRNPWFGCKTSATKP